MPYRWDPKSKRFRDPKGRYISQRNIRQLLDVAIDTKEVSLLTRAYKQGDISKDVWHQGMRQAIKKSHLQAGMLARGGKNALSAKDRLAMGANVGEQYFYLDGKPDSFLDSIDGLTEKQAIARARMYVESSRKQFEEFMRDNKLDIGAVWEKWVLGNKEHCEDCLALAGRGMVSIGTLGTVPCAGDTVCLTNCGCRIAYYSKSRRTLTEDLGNGYGEVFVEIPISLVIQSLQGRAFTYFEELNLITFDEPQGHLAAKLGGSGSGHHGHAGIPGQVGGSVARVMGVALALQQDFDFAVFGSAGLKLHLGKGFRSPNDLEVLDLRQIKETVDVRWKSLDDPRAQTTTKKYEDGKTGVQITSYESGGVMDSVTGLKAPKIFNIDGTKNYEEIGGYKVISLKSIVQQKVYAGRDKDVMDVKEAILVKSLPRDYVRGVDYKIWWDEVFTTKLARPRRDKCMLCPQLPVVEVVWANGKGHAWFCAPCYKQWKKERHEVDYEKDVEHGIARPDFSDPLSPKSLEES